MALDPPTHVSVCESSSQQVSVSSDAKDMDIHFKAAINPLLSLGQSTDACLNTKVLFYECRLWAQDVRLLHQHFCP